MAVGNAPDRPAPGASTGQALADLYAPLMAFFRRHLPAHRRHEAADLTHETLLNAWAALKDPARGNVRDVTAYVLGIARNKYSDAIKDRHLLRSVSLDEADLDGYHARAKQAATEYAVESRERIDRCLTFLAELPPLDREILRLRYQEELSNEEASRRLGVTPDESSRLKYRALERLRRLLTDGPGRRNAAGKRPIDR